MIALEELPPGELLHLERQDVPLCGAPPEGAYVVERLIYATCAVCIAVSAVPRALLAPGGEA